MGMKIIEKHRIREGERKERKGREYVERETAPSLSLLMPELIHTDL